MSLDHVHALPLGTRLGDYRLDAVIGHGGFGITYRAFDSQLAKIVAIKEYLPVEFAVRGADNKVVPRAQRLADDFAWGRDRFLEEARALARFRHPHIVPVLRYLEANGTAYTVMEFEDGRSVADLLPSGRRLPPPDVKRLAEGLISGLKAVHAQGFLHRDIKPSNIIVRRDDGVPVLIDFGAARQAIGGRTRTLTSVLTPQYAPIEQYALDGKQGPWSDIYAAAAVLHRAVAGEPPPEAASRVGRDPYRPLARTQADRFDQAFLTAIDRGLAFAPEERPQTIEEWRALFGNTLPALPSVADAPTQKMASRDPVAAQAPRLGGVQRGQQTMPPPAAKPRPKPKPEPRPQSKPGRRLPFNLVASLLVVAVAAVGAWQLRGRIESLVAGVTTPPPAPAPKPVPAPPPAPPKPVDYGALIEQARQAAADAHVLSEKVKETASAAFAMAGEARIVAARAASPSLEKAERQNSDDGASYVGQVADGRRQGLGVLAFKDGGRQAGEWRDNLLSGLGIDLQAGGTHYEGQWRDGFPNGLGVRETPGVERIDGTFAAGTPDGPGIRRTFGERSTVQIGLWQGGAISGVGVEMVGDNERYEGGFRAGRRHGYGQLTGADEKVTLGRWDDGKLVESAP